MASHPSTLLDRLGGPDALLAAVEVLYDNVTSDARLAPIFEGVHVMRLVKHQHNFLKLAFDESGSEHDDSVRMVRAHARLIRDKGLNVEHFDMMMDHLRVAMRSIAHADIDAEEAVGRMFKYRAHFPESAAVQAGPAGPAGQGAGTGAAVPNGLGMPLAGGAAHLSEIVPPAS